MNKRVKIAACALLPVLSVLTACSRTDTPAQAGPTSPAARLLWMGDSIAVGEAVPLAAATKASGVAMESMASEGGGNVAGIPELTATTRDQLAAKLASFKPGVVAYQVSTFDWGAGEEQRGAYEQLLSTVSGAGAKLLLVTVPPIKADEFYAPHVEELGRTTGLVREVADGSGGKAAVLDSAEVWGPTYQQDRDGRRDRHPDGIHTCPQGAARFTDWFLRALAEQAPDVVPAAPEAWANTGWAGDPAFRGC